MPFNTDSDLIAGQRNGQWPEIAKGSVTSEGIGTYQSLWKAAGMPAAGANPPLFSAGSGYVPTSATAGAIPFSNPVAPAITVLSNIIMEFATAGSLMICDRLWACSGFATNTANLQSITTPGVLPSGRDPFNGSDVIPMLEVYTAPGATGATCTVTGTDALGNTNRTWTYTHPANAETVGQMVQLLPGGASPAAVLGMRVPVSLQWSGTTGGAGDVGITLIRFLANVTTNANQSMRDKGPFDLGLRRVYDDSCLMMRMLCSATNTGLINGRICLAQN